MRLNQLNDIQCHQVEVIETELAGAPSAQVSVRVAEILPTMANAFQSGFQWIRDFDDDQVQIPTDLLDLIQRFKQSESGPKNQSA